MSNILDYKIADHMDICKGTIKNVAETYDKISECFFCNKCGNIIARIE
jgi:hypothetical protein